MRKSLFMIFVGLMMFGSMKCFANIAEGVNGTCNWVITDEGQLIVSPVDGVEGILSGCGDYYGEVDDELKEMHLNSRIWQKYNNSITSVLFKGVITAKSCAGMFSYFYNLKSIEWGNFKTDNVTDMFEMFYCCRSLESLDLSGFNTSKVTHMDRMFEGCKSLKSLDLRKFNTSNVISMRNMFSACSSLTSLDVNSFNTSNVISMRNMFGGCSSLTSLDVSKFNTSSVAYMGGMFSGCRSLTSLDVNSFNTSKVTDMSYMFNVCESLTSLDVSNFNTSKVTDMSNMFYNCRSLTSLDVSNFNTSKVTDMSNMFYNCRSLTSLDVSSFNTSNVTDMAEMFGGCISLTSLDVSSFNTSKVTNMKSMFRGCVSLTSLDLSSFNTSNVTNMHSMFYNCVSLTSLDLTNFTVIPSCNYDVVFYSVKANIISNSKTPSSLPDYFFDTYEPESPYCLVVPAGSENEYLNASGWRYLMPHVMTDENPMVPQMYYYKYMLGYERKVSGKYATFCLPFLFSISAVRASGFSNKIYTIESVGKMDKTVRLIKLSVKEASESTILNTGTPFIVELEEGQDKITFFSNYRNCNCTYGYPEPQKFSINVASDVEVAISGTLFNKLTNLDRTKYRAFNTDGDFGPADWVNTFRAYVYKDDRRSSAKVDKIVLCFEDGTTTSLDEIDGLEVVADNAPVYNLNGQRVNGDAKGLLIKSGKKMFVK